MKDLILVHMSPTEINAFSQMQGGAYLDSKLGVPNLSKLSEMIFSSKELQKEIADIIKHVESLPKGQQDKLEEENEEIYDHPSKAEHTQTRNKALMQIARKGTKDDKKLCLMPEKLVRFFSSLREPVVNKETGLFEFGFFKKILKSVARPVERLLGGRQGHSGASRHASAMAEIARQQAAAHEKYLRDIGFHDPWKNNALYERERLTPENKVVTEYYDPRTDEPVSYKRAVEIRDELIKEDPELGTSYRRYKPTEEEQKIIDRRSPKSIEFDRNDIRDYGKGKKSLLDLVRTSSEDNKRKALKSADLLAIEDEKKKDKKEDSEESSPKNLSSALHSIRNFLPSERYKNSSDNEDEDDGILSKKSKSLQDKIPSFKRMKSLQNKSHGGSIRSQALQSIQEGLKKKPAFRSGGSVKEIHTSGGILGKGTGQSDDIHARLPVGTYILPAEVAPAASIRKKTAANQSLASVRVANEEYKIDPATVTELGHGNLHAGSKKLDAFVKQVRSHSRANGLKLPPASKEINEYLR